MSTIEYRFRPSGCRRSPRRLRPQVEASAPASVDRVLERVVVDERGHAAVLALAIQDLAIVDAVLEAHSARAVNAPTMRL
jgi:hypothetical protein